MKVKIRVGRRNAERNLDEPKSLKPARGARYRQQISGKIGNSSRHVVEPFFGDISSVGNFCPLAFALVIPCLMQWLVRRVVVDRRSTVARLEPDLMSDRDTGGGRFQTKTIYNDAYTTTKITFYVHPGNCARGERELGLFHLQRRGKIQD